MQEVTTDTRYEAAELAFSTGRLDDAERLAEAVLDVRAIGPLVVDHGGRLGRPRREPGTGWVCCRDPGYANPGYDGFGAIPPVTAR